MWPRTIRLWVPFHSLNLSGLLFIASHSHIYDQEQIGGQEKALQPTLQKKNNEGWRQTFYDENESDEEP